MRRRHALPALFVLAGTPFAASAQPTSSNIRDLGVDSFRYSWGENFGWMNWSDANARSQGVRVHGGIGFGGFLAGYIWCENVGWVFTGDADPDSFSGSTRAYANDNTTDKGVNFDSDGYMSGFAWGENIGWINFDTRAALEAHGQHARVDQATGEILGYAWSENCGWVYLGIPSARHVEYCPGDWNGDGTLDAFDYDDFVSDFFNYIGSGTGSPDFNADGTVDAFDYDDFVSTFFNGC